jgi:hypothetical protein
VSEFARALVRSWPLPGVSLATVVCLVLVLAGSAAARPATIWRAVTGFYGTRQLVVTDICEARYANQRFAFVQVRLGGRRHLAALQLLRAGRGWMVMWADGRVNRRIGSATLPLVLAEVTRLKAKCLAP